MKIPKPATRKARIEIIPMIDAIFFLLVFFMFSSLSMIRMRGANIALPAGQSGASGAATSPKLIVSVTGNGAYFLNKKRISSQTLQSELQEEVKNRPNAVVIVNMAKTQNTQTLINVLDSINKVTTPSGTQVSALIATEPVDAQGLPTQIRTR